MTKCQLTNCENTDLVYSGVDAFLLGVPTEKFCYSCANAYGSHIENMVC